MIEGEQEDLDQLLKTDGFTKEIMMGSTIRDLGSTIKEAKQSFPNQKHPQTQEIAEEGYLEEFDGSHN